jgi:hypothetical protein
MIATLFFAFIGVGKVFNAVKIFCIANGRQENAKDLSLHFVAHYFHEFTMTCLNGIFICDVYFFS